MAAQKNIGIVGATGLVGSMMREILVKREFPMASIRCFASARSAGKTIEVGDSEVTVEDLATADFSGLDIVLLSAGGSVSKEYAPKIAAAGAVAIDNSSAWRMDPDVPLVVSEVNPDDIHNRPKGIVANPNCTTMAAMPVLRPLRDMVGIERVVASTYQAVSGAGVAGVRELDEQLQKLSGRADELASSRPTGLPVPETFPRTIANNVVPFAGNAVGEDTDEELKFRNESRKILSLPNLDVTCTCVRVPVFTGHSMTLDIEFARDITSDEARKILVDAPGVQLSDIPTPLDATGGDVSLVGRIRQSGEKTNRLTLFLSGDNLRKGAALNTVQLAELLA
jgi:aspartate-semialdehyde dehydrogenase